MITYCLLRVGAFTQSALEDAFRKVESFGWHVQIFAPAALIGDVAPVIRNSGGTVVLDHMAGASDAAGTDEPGIQIDLGLFGARHVLVKLSAPQPDSRLRRGRRVAG
jgi:predicted TIM-barrel fold metal-dependent hydrolase